MNFIRDSISALVEFVNFESIFFGCVTVSFGSYYKVQWNLSNEMGMSYQKYLNSIISLIQSLWNHVYSTCGESPVLRDHKIHWSLYTGLTIPKFQCLVDNNIIYYANLFIRYLIIQVDTLIWYFRVFLPCLYGSLYINYKQFLLN